MGDFLVTHQGIELKWYNVNMKENKISIEIKRPISEVFEFTINPKNTHLWIENVQKEETNEWPIKVGSRYRNTGNDGVWDEYEVIDLKQNELFELKMVNGTYHVRYTYKPIDTNNTELTYFEWDENGIKSPFQQIVLAKLKDILES